MRAGILVVAAVACCAAIPTAGGQTPPPACQSNSGANVDAPKLIAWQRNEVIKVFATTAEAQSGTFSVSAADPARPIAHPVSLPYAQLGSRQGNRLFRLKVEKGDGNAVAALTWTKTENGASCTAQVKRTITINKGRRPFISVVHERSPKIIFGHERPECHETAVLSWKLVVTGPGGTVRQSIADICASYRFFHRRGSNPHFRLTHRSGAMVFTAHRPRGTYRASYLVTVGGKLAVKGGLRAVVRNGKVIVVISIRRP